MTQAFDLRPKMDKIVLRLSKDIFDVSRPFFLPSQRQSF